MEYRYELSEVVDWNMNKKEGKFVFGTRDNIEEDWGPFDVFVFINDLDWQPDDPDIDPDIWYPECWHLEDFKIYKIEFYPEGEERVSEEKLKEVVGISNENLKYLKETAEYELCKRVSAWINRYGVQVSVYKD